MLSTNLKHLFSKLIHAFQKSIFAEIVNLRGLWTCNYYENGTKEKFCLALKQRGNHVYGELTHAAVENNIEFLNSWFVTGTVEQGYLYLYLRNSPQTKSSASPTLTLKLEEAGEVLEGCFYFRHFYTNQVRAVELTFSYQLRNQCSIPVSPIRV